MLETNRGCPFTCTFCVQGVRWYTKVHNFGKDDPRHARRDPAVALDHALGAVLAGRGVDVPRPVVAGLRLATYQMDSRFRVLPNYGEYAGDRAHGVESAVADFERLWDDFHRYVEHKHTHGTTRDTLLSPTQVTLHYDIEGWIAAGMPHDAGAFRLASAQPFVFELAPDAARELDGLITTWSTDLRGLTKGIPRMRTTSLIRRCRQAEAAL